MTRLVQADARRPEPVGAYGTVVSAYCADSATAGHATWRTYMHHIAGAVGPDGLFITSALCRCRGYLAAGKPFPYANVDEHDVRDVLATVFGSFSGSVEVRDLPEHSAQGYSGIVLASATRGAS